MLSNNSRTRVRDNKRIRMMTLKKDLPEREKDVKVCEENENKKEV